MKKFIYNISLFAALIMLVGCGISGGAAPPTVIIGAPANAAQYQVGQDVAVQSTSSDVQGITRVELIVDGQTVKTDTMPTGTPQIQFTTIQVWNATTPGAHIIVVRATNVGGKTSDAAVSITIIGEVAVAQTTTPTATSPGVINTVTPIPTATEVTANPTQASGCTLNSAFVADVSVPDGTIVNAGASFVKTWRVLNPQGACAWDTGYTLVFVGGEAMGAPSSSPVPPTAAGATVDLSLSMTAPAAAGNHTGQWKLRSSDGAFFGTTLDVIISVPGPPPPPTNTPQPTATNAPPQPGPTKTPTPTPQPPNAATGFNSTVTGQTTATTNWVDNATNEDGFRVYRSIPGNDVLVASRAGNAGTGNTQLTLSGLVCSETYVLYVVSYKGGVESASSNTDSITTDPCTPSNVIAPSHTGKTVRVTWTDNSTSPEESGFKIYVGGVLKQTIPGSQDGTGTRAFDLTGLDCGTLYSDIRVTAYYGTRESPKSSTAGNEETTGCSVKVEFTRIDVLNDTDADPGGFNPPNPGEINLTLTVEGETKYWPSQNGTENIYSHSSPWPDAYSRTFSVIFTKSMSRSNQLSVIAHAVDKGDDPDDMFVLLQGFSGYQPTNFGAGSHTLQNAYYKVYFTITVTSPP